MEKAGRLSIIYFYLLSISRLSTLHTHIHLILSNPDIQCYLSPCYRWENWSSEKSSRLLGNYTFHFLLTSIKAPISFHLFLNGVQCPVCQQGIRFAKAHHAQCTVGILDYYTITFSQSDLWSKALPPSLLLAGAQPLPWPACASGCGNNSSGAPGHLPNSWDVCKRCPRCDIPAHALPGRDARVRLRMACGWGSVERVAAAQSSVSAAMLCFVSQPVDNQQALVRRESVVNLENFKKQYVRRRWKVCQGLGVGSGGLWVQGTQVGSWFPPGSLCTFSPGTSSSLPPSALFQHCLLV